LHKSTSVVVWVGMAGVENVDEKEQVFFGGAGASSRPEIPDIPERAESDHESECTAVKELKADIIRSLQDEVYVLVEKKYSETLKNIFNQLDIITEVKNTQGKIMTKLSSLEAMVNTFYGVRNDNKDLIERVEALEQAMHSEAERWEDQSATSSQHTETSMIQKNSRTIYWIRLRINNLRDEINKVEQFIQSFGTVRDKIVNLLRSDNLHRDIVKALTTDPNQNSLGLNMNALAAIRSDLQDVASTFRDYQHGFYR
jgi:BMFP domain-containing protein YqiC